MHTKSRACHTAQDSKQALALKRLYRAPLYLLCLCAALLSYPAAAQAEHLSQGTCTTLSVNPWTPPEPAAPKVIYGEDDRIDVYQETDEQHLAWAQCTCGLTDWSGLTNLGNGTYQLAMYQYEIWDGTRYLPPCSGEAFTGQPTAMWCSGFMVGEDLIATAGHCVDASSLAGVAFIFGFQMQDANTPVQVFDESQVYTGVELVGRRLTNNLDYSIVRVDRPITAPGAYPLPIRRDGVIAAGEPVGVIGHPSGLPMKIAFGDQTVVRDSSNTGYFLANTDTCGGNSGSPVWNQNTGLIEGILVTGDTDFIYTASCFRSNVNSDTGGLGEGVSKSTTFAQYIPELAGPLGEFTLDRTAYACSDTITLSLVDGDLYAESSVSVSITSSIGDEETVELAAGSGFGEFEGAIALAGGAAQPGNGLLEATGDDTITAVYVDEDTGEGLSAEVSITVSVDCSAPEITSSSIGDVWSDRAEILAETGEPCTLYAQYGTACDNLTLSATGSAGQTEHVLYITGLDPETTYYVLLTATDAAGNESTPSAECLVFTTTEEKDYFTQHFGQANDLELKQALWTPVEGRYELCISIPSGFPVNPGDGQALDLDNDGSATIVLQNGALVPFYGQTCGTLYVNANGNITFHSADPECVPSLDVHFAQPRVSAFFTDLNPAQAGEVDYAQYEDRVAVTWNGVYASGSPDGNHFQVELFFDGTIRITWLVLESLAPLVGLSEGAGLPLDYVASDLSAYPRCSGSVEGEGEAEGEAEGQTDGEGELIPEGEGAAEGEGETQLEGEAEAVPEGEGEIEGEGAAEGEGEAQLEGEGEAETETPDRIDQLRSGLASQFTTLDRDDSGTLSLSEVRAAYSDVTDAEFAALDTDGSQLLSRTELGLDEIPVTGCSLGTTKRRALGDLWLMGAAFVLLSAIGRARRTE